MASRESSAEHAEWTSTSSPLSPPSSSGDHRQSYPLPMTSDAAGSARGRAMRPAGYVLYRRTCANSNQIQITLLPLVQMGPYKYVSSRKCIAPESFNVSNNSVHVLCIDRKPRCFQVEWHYYEIFRCSIPYIYRRISRAVESINFTTIVFSLPHIMAPKFANQLPIRNVGRTCNGSGNVWNWESRYRCTGKLENTAPHKIRCDNFFLNFVAWRCYPCNLCWNHPEKSWWDAKTNASKRLVCWLENSRFQFQKSLCKWSWLL